ncbi:SusD/RagB family nutrient-binding outer membrane lipoprotein [Flavobacterium sp. MAH-1]|uniref:SusD/RagB family nutrient-binding outer membrane lipoprotein n=1 Tax=Flavobacterium agri TaxID=2743471 RepID=A0A7Y8Y3V4_9FLAO|nr:SusD/RagB family nutrient-binding outer membrane lipoprotein [Flavobacterium agri]NUY81848.1 SusD/RagB family nutrient-binding outer membrane lipoprotein [Flavobacterium agri]NYA71872.1 SusD/RagB family nutrient-binding outer membrane lipoprotein [Flavobacterium agri]
MKKIKFIIPILALSLFSCDDYLDVNSPVDNPTGDQVTPDLSLAAAETGPYRTFSRTGMIFGNLFMNNWGFNVNAFAVTNPEEFSLALTNSSYSGLWDGFYTSTANLTNIIKHPAANYENHKAIAKILKSFYFQYLVDLYGDIPYSEAHLGSQNLSPAYDDDQVVYRDLVVQIEEAIDIIDNPSSSTIAVGNEDVIFQGDMQAWKRFANTLKLRLLLRQSEMTDAETTTYLAQEFSELSSATFVTSDVIINPGYSNANTEQQNPVYGLFFDVGGNSSAFYRQYGASKYFGDNLNDNTLPDPRRSRIFTGLVGGNVAGVIQGDVSVNNGGTAPPNISQFGAAIVSSADQDGYMMLASESFFLQAEAVLRGYIPGDAQAFFDAGVQASMVQMSAVNPTAYLNGVNGVPGKGFSSAYTFEQNMRAIMYQKNVALTGANAMEVFIEYTRTGFIDEIPLAGVPAGSATSRPHRQRRLLYPTTELVGNSANVPTLSLDDIFNQGPFWLVEQ